MPFVGRPFNCKADIISEEQTNFEHGSFILFITDLSYIGERVLTIKFYP